MLSTSQSPLYHRTAPRGLVAALPASLAYESVGLAEFRVLCLLYEFGGGAEWIAAPPRDLAIYLAHLSPRPLSARAAGRALDRLTQLGYLERGAKRHIYRCVTPAWPTAAIHPTTERSAVA